ncbi:MAG TPA: PepSY-associated TM helix domain-containing protein [Terracidiphilus sp.]|nr:PepSY-associated TM helix domain-containing protein [Terracidiphilus sp.]
MITTRTIRLWYRIHKWSSLICTAFLLMACMTGLPLIFHEELGDMLDHHVAPAKMPENTAPASLDKMVDAAQRKLPALHPYSIALDDDEPRVLVIMTPSPKPAAKDFHFVSFDEHTGRMLETGQSAAGPLSWLLRLHEELFLGLGGELLMGAMALLFAIAVVSGGLVYGPFMKRLNFGTYRQAAPRRTRWFDLHNLLGIVTLVWALVMGATGVMNALSTPLFGLWRMQALPPLLAPFHGKPTPVHLRSVDASVAEVAAAMPGMKIDSILFPNPVIASPRHYVIFANGTTPITSRLSSAALIDVETGGMTLVKNLPWYLRALEVSRPLHFGDYGGLPLKILWALFDIATIAVLVSGVYLWLSKKSAFEIEMEQAVLAA